MVLLSLWCTQYHQRYSAVRADTAALFLARPQTPTWLLVVAQVMDISIAPVVVGPCTHTWPLDVTQARHHQGTRWQHRPFTSSWSLDINMALGGCTDCTSHCLRWHRRIHTSACSSPKSHLQFHLSPQHRKHSASLSLPSFYHILAHHSDSSLEASGCLQPSLCLENGRTGLC